MSYPQDFYAYPGPYYRNPADFTSPQPQPTIAPTPEQIENSYIENIIRYNRGRIANVYMTFPGKAGNQTKVFTGMLLSAARDHIIIKDIQNNRTYLLLMVYLDYIEFEGNLNYIFPPPLSEEEQLKIQEQFMILSQQYGV